VNSACQTAKSMAASYRILGSNAADQRASADACTEGSRQSGSFIGWMDNKPWFMTEKVAIVRNSPSYRPPSPV
jgi:hypothetical protein